MSGTRVLPVVAMAVVLWSGCVQTSGDGTVAPPAGAEELAPEPVVTSTTGAIAGVITDEAYQPIAGANVTVRDSTIFAVSDVEGSFTLNELEPGEYTMLVSRTGFDTAALLATVNAGEVTRLVTNLARLAVVKPYVEPYEVGGHIGCAAVGVNIVLGSPFLIPCAGSDPNTQVSWIFDVAETVETVVVALEWTPTNVVGNEMQIWLEPCIDPAQISCPTYYAIAVGESPLVARAEKDAFAEATFTNGTTPMRIRTAPGSSDPTSPSIVLEQPYRVYVNFFHHAPAPAGFTGIPDR